ncbi:hypothetical protein Micbo1qcDRAFT_229623 [Microdochium bolleyi]|uniref:Rhodopsin domain-containing protein n=1 Tax=Microdochium bolleyi TaxID=196109 RepID=A0A136JI39_9PEZI|nr:hypothetical protein Micbo1qcDRAFT_229623 [Microdochium bolleyi]
MSAPPQADAFLGLRDEDHSAILASITVAALLMTTSIITGKLLYRRAQRVWRNYDFILLAGVGFLLAQSALVVYAASLGIGRHASTLDEARLDRIAKTQFAISILWVSVMFCTKISMCWFIDAINSFTQIQWANRILVGIISTLSVISIVATGFRCPLPAPWRAVSSAMCPTAVPVYTFTLISCIITDVLICLIASVMIVRVQTTLHTKALIIGLFSIRLLVAGAVSPALAGTSYVHNGSDTDFTWEALRPNIWLTVAGHLSVITACIPSLKGVVDSWLGNTFGIDIDSPYQLERMRGTKGGFAVTDHSTQGGGSSRSGTDYHRSNGALNSTLSKLSSRASRFAERAANGKTSGSRADALSAASAALKLTTSSPTEASCYANGAEGPTKGKTVRNSNQLSNKQDGQSESVRGLTDGVIMIHSDIEVKYDEVDHRDGSSYSSRD